MSQVGCILEVDTCNHYTEHMGHFNMPQKSYGVYSAGTSLLKFDGPYSTNIGCLYLLDSEYQYKIFKLKNRSHLMLMPATLWTQWCLYWMQQISWVKAGAKYGTGQCDALCPHDL